MRRKQVTVAENRLKEPLIKSFDKLRTNGKLLIPFVVSSAFAEPVEASNHTHNRLNQGFLNPLWRLQASLS